MSVNEEIDRKWDELVMEGIVVPIGKDRHGEVEWTFDMEKLELLEPELWHAHLDELDSDLLSMQSKGLIEIDLSHGDVQFNVTEKGQAVIDAMTRGDE
jgi:hypothetical protein